MKEAIRSRALELGLDDCRFTTAEPPASGPHFQRWLAEHHHGEMAYLERNAPKRLDPQQVLAGAKSIITLAVSYGEVRSQKSEVRSLAVNRTNSLANPQSSILNHQFPALVARYARGNDYHDVIGEQLKALVEFVNRLSGEGTRSLWHVDTGPVLERDFAQRAGLGFIGKHTNLVSRRFGNWICLGQITTTLELAPDAPEKNRCGSCARCLAACPTRAITAPFQLDARLCLSYLTIELKGPIPPELRPAIGRRIFGCDDCLAACPWNRFAREGKLMKAQARPDLATPDLVELLSLDEAGFKTRFAGTPILRAKRRGLLRNVCVALGNVGDETALPALRRVANDSEPLIAEHARWAIEQIEARRKAAPEASHRGGKRHVE